MSTTLLKVKKMLLPIKKKVKRFFYCTILRKKTVHFIHISKTGGTALQVALHEHTVTKQYILEFHDHNTKLVDIPVGEKVFFFLRNPSTRFVSGFYTRWRRGMPRNNSPWNYKEERAFKIFDTPNKLALALSSDNSQEKDSAIQAMQDIGHINMHLINWFENEEYFMSRLEDIFFIGFQENFTEDFEHLKVKLGIKAGVKLPTDDVGTHKTPSGFDTSLDTQALENIKTWYAQDFDFYALCKRLKSNIQ